MKKITNLDTLRLIDASFVIVHHIELCKQGLSIESYFYVPFIKVIRKLRVVLYFVLSWFLITNLLQNENISNNGISFNKFYMLKMFFR